MNLYLGNGFTSTAWYVQPSNEFWAGNVPLHSALLYLWIKIFGFSIVAVRSVNVLVIAPNNFEEVTNAIGGHWASTGRKFVPERSGFLGTKINLGFLSTQNYHLEIYRRIDALPETVATPNQGLSRQEKVTTTGAQEMCCTIL